RRAALGALGRHDELALAAVAQVGDRAEDLGDDVAGLAQHHRVADEDPFGLDDVLVVQGGELDLRPGDGDRLDLGVGRDPARAAHAHADVDQLGVDLLGRVLVRDGPARGARGGAEAALERDLVQLHDDAVDLVRHGVAVLAVVRDELPDALDAVDHLVVRRGGQAPGLEQVVSVGPAGVAPGEALQRADAVHQHVQRAGGGHARVLLPQRTGRRVARVGEGLVAGGHQAGVELLELLHREEDLAPDLHQVGHLLAGEPVGDLRDGADVGRDVLTGAAVAAGRRAGEAAPLVGEVDGQAVDLELAQEVELLVAQLPVDALDPGGEILVVEGVVQGEHARAVLDGGELRLVRPRDLPGRRVGRAQRGGLLLQGLQLAQQPVELGVADHGRVVHVVPEAVLLDLLRELYVLLARLGGHARRLRLLVAGHRGSSRYSGLSARDLAARTQWA